MSDPITDQWQAAAEDARRRLYNVPTGGDVIAVDLRDDAPRGARERMMEHVLAHYTQGEEGATPACPHVTSAPNVVFAAAAWPGKVFCGDCFQNAWNLYATLWSKFGCFTPCDNCHGKPVPGTVDGSSTGVVNFGPIMVTISLCKECTEIREAGGD